MSVMAAAAFPLITFQSAAIVPKSADQYEVRGLLSIRSQTQPVALIARITPQEGGIWVEGSGRISLADFGFKPPRGIFGVRSFIGTKDEMTVQFLLFAKELYYAE
jgi:polyisoprenoid-binding protein YceI